MKSRFEYLGNNITIEVSRSCTFGEDALLLAQFAKPRVTDQVCDLGTGCGILPLLWCREMPALRVEALEVQPEAAEMASRSVQNNGLSETVRIQTADFRRWRDVLLPESYDLVTMNPPYFAPQSGVVSQSESLRVTRHEGVGCTISDVTKAASGLLRFGGRFCLCHRPERLCDVFENLRAAGLEPKRMRFVQADSDSVPWLFLCETRKGGKPGLTIMPSFYQKNRDGTPSQDQAELYYMFNNTKNIQE